MMVFLALVGITVAAVVIVAYLDWRD